MRLSSRLWLVVALLCVGIVVGTGITRLLVARPAGDVTEQRAAAVPPAEARSAPTTSPTAAWTRLEASVPTAAPTSAPTAADPVVAILEQVAQAEAVLRTGEFQAEIDDDDGVRSSATLRFDLGDGQQAPRLSITATYEEAEGVRTTERVTIGEETWERQSGGTWVLVPDQAVVWDQVQGYLPHAGSGSDPELTVHLDVTELRWNDAGRDADVTLLIDPQTNVPREMRRSFRTMGITLMVRYVGWNTPVEIEPPEGP